MSGLADELRRVAKSTDVCAIDPADFPHVVEVTGATDPVAVYEACRQAVGDLPDEGVRSELELIFPATAGRLPPLKDRQTAAARQRDISFSGYRRIHPPTVGTSHYLNALDSLAQALAARPKPPAGRDRAWRPLVAVAAFLLIAVIATGAWQLVGNDDAPADSVLEGTPNRSPDSSDAVDGAYIGDTNLAASDSGSSGSVGPQSSASAPTEAGAQRLNSRRAFDDPDVLEAKVGAPVKTFDPDCRYRLGEPAVGDRKVPAAIADRLRREAGDSAGGCAVGPTFHVAGWWGQALDGRVLAPERAVIVNADGSESATVDYNAWRLLVDVLSGRIPVDGSEIALESVAKTDGLAELNLTGGAKVVGGDGGMYYFLNGAFAQRWAEPEIKRQYGPPLSHTRREGADFVQDFENGRLTLDPEGELTFEPLDPGDLLTLNEVADSFIDVPGESWVVTQEGRLWIPDALTRNCLLTGPSDLTLASVSVLRDIPVLGAANCLEGTFKIAGVDEFCAANGVGWRAGLVAVGEATGGGDQTAEVGRDDAADDGTDGGAAESPEVPVCLDEHGQRRFAINPDDVCVAEYAVGWQAVVDPRGWHWFLCASSG